MQSERESALTALRDLGVMQIEFGDHDSVSSTTASAFEQLNRLKHIYGSLEQIAADRQMSGNDLPCAAENAADLAKKVVTYQERLAALDAEISDIRRRLEALDVWGEFDRDLFDGILNSGIDIQLCLGSNDDLRMAQSMENCRCEVINRTKGKIAFAVISLEKTDIECLPVISLSKDDDPKKLKQKLQVDLDEKSSVEKELVACAGKRGLIAAEIEEKSALWEFCRVRDSIGEYGEIAVLNGFVPEPQMQKLVETANDQGWGLAFRDPYEDEEVPVLLKNNRFTRIIKPLFDFLGIVPGYREIDISGAVLIFFTIFYAIIIGDAGYGIVFGIVSLAGLRLSRKHPGLLAPMRLLLILSIAATVWGALCGSWFGLSVIPGTNKAIPALECFRDFSASSAKQANIQFFCFILAVIQLSAGRIWRALKEGNFRAFGQHLGWMLIIWGNFFLTVRLIVYPGEFPQFMYILYGVGLLMVMICGVNWKQASDVFQFPFDIIGSFTDVLSYIRLFAVGLAGACIAGSFNGMAFDLCKVSAWLLPAGILVALVGHALNIALALLSVLVHAVRLNTLEFSNHTGLSWSGQSFNPFKSNKKQE